ncbi:uncharacterized protein LOC122389569 isoform X2 [Amphibalanus amphitrite]|uniref:uncharacterized protein LOC122389569 isoform X2 n=1 Tax=Amphibalanus amphitrite TaxID=1232801 RepID=UPI001C9105D3|nr:uncharacterized protein LOC122389569 isoform X2 [Amphibalanus amphitrite]
MDLDKLQVAELKRELDRRGEDTRGTKSVLRERLGQVLKEELAQSALGDKVSVKSSPEQEQELKDVKEGAEGARSVRSGSSSTRTSSKAASVASERALEAARRAGLRTKAAALKKRHELEAMQEELRRKKEELEVQAELDESLAKEEVLAQFERETLMTSLEERVMKAHEQEERNEQELPRHEPEMKQEMKRDEPEQEHGQRNEQEMRNEMRNEPRTRSESRKTNEARRVDQELKKREQEARNKREPRKHVRERRREEEPNGEEEPREIEEDEESSREEARSTRMKRSEVEIASVLPNLKRLGMQPPELIAFDGKEEEFAQFLAAFEANIAANLDSEEEKLLYLLQMTKKKPHDIVATCTYLGQKGYQEAVRLLKARYTDFTSARASLIDKVLSHPPIRYEDVEGLDSFTILLRGVLNALHSTSRGGLEPGTICKIIEKVPWMADRWRRTADRIQQEHQRQASFTDLVDFMETEARISKNPAYGRHVLATRARPERGPQEAQRMQVRRYQDSRKDTKHSEHQFSHERSRAYASSMKQPEKCFYCDQPHELEVCRAFEAKSEQDKSQYVRQNGLCFGCLKKGHLSKNCEQRSRCKKCEKSHPTSLHREPPANANVVKSGHVSQACEGGGKLQVLPISANFGDRSVGTGAFIDAGSTHSFITRKLVRQLGMQPEEKTSVVMSTINGERRMKTALVTGVSIGSEDGSHLVELPVLYVVDHIPVEEEDVARQEDVDKWPHLRERGVKIGWMERMDIGLHTHRCERRCGVRTRGSGESPWSGGPICCQNSIWLAGVWSTGQDGTRCSCRTNQSHQDPGGSRSGILRQYR